MVGTWELHGSGVEGTRAIMKLEGMSDVLDVLYILYLHSSVLWDVALALEDLRFTFTL